MSQSAHCMGTNSSEHRQTCCQLGAGGSIHSKEPGLSN